MEARGDRLSLRATLPPKPGSNKTKSYQQYITLSIYDNPAELQRAEAEAKIVGELLARGEFDWGRYLCDEQELGIGDWATWIEKLRANYFAQKGDTLQSQFTWKNDYEAAFKNLKGEVVLVSPAFSTRRCANGTSPHCTSFGSQTQAGSDFVVRMLTVVTTLKSQQRNATFSNF